MTSRTFVMCKPDAVERGLVGEIVVPHRAQGPARWSPAELRSVDTALAEAHYEEHAEQAVLRRAGSFLTRSPVFAMVVEGPDDDTWELCRILIGKTQVTDAQPGSIRGDFATTTTENLVHGSDGPESAEREIALWFPGA